MSNTYTTPPKQGFIKLWASRFFGTSGRLVGTLSLILSAVSVILTIGLKIYPETTPYIILLRDFLVLASLVITIVILAHQYYMRGTQIEKKDERIKNLITLAHNQSVESYALVHEYRNAVFSHFWETRGEHLSFDLGGDEVRLLRHVCNFATDNVRGALLNNFRLVGLPITDEDISISVKLVVETEKLLEIEEYANRRRELQAKNQWVMTIYRDPHTHSHMKAREVGGVTLYDLDNNTAFKSIAQDKALAFHCNNLQGLGVRYKNQNPDWDKFYNATLVVPIRYRNPVSGNETLFGFLTSDSMNPHNLILYNELECKSILSHCADLLATLFLYVALDKVKVGNDAE